MKTIVIVGGGYGGVALAKALEKQHHSDDSVRILLIEAKSHFYHTVGGLRAAVQDLDDVVFIPYANVFTSSRHQVVHATVNRFDKKAVYLDSVTQDGGDQIAYDFLVIATGTNYAAPARIECAEMDQGKQQLQQIRQQIKQARHVLIVGGGPVGIELAGELKDANLKDQQVTLIHSQSQLGHPSYMPLKVHHKLVHLMTSHGIQVLLDDKVDLPPSSSGTMVVVPSTPLATSHKGADLSSVDLIVMATGNRPSPQWIQASVPDLLQSDNYVKVKPTLQVDHPDFPNLFVLGDIAGLDEAKLAYRAANGHTPVVAANINTLLTNGTHLKEYKKGIDIMLITFGKSNGVTILPWGIVLGGWMSSLIKSKTLFYDRYWKELNQPVPNSLK
ncbi:hypothetical protein [Absidia glauca]|uniref:FAD/NAD(P)-binding domain-containing protein n=1 Tax=Absidia glauca TaxID=4829 RepID=A0A163J3T8_ABSGL|nr:hypothetical protein [Absidia glauca]